MRAAIRSNARAGLAEALLIGWCNVYSGAVATRAGLCSSSVRISVSPACLGQASVTETDEPTAVTDVGVGRADGGHRRRLVARDERQVSVALTAPRRQAPPRARAATLHSPAPSAAPSSRGDAGGTIAPASSPPSPDGTHRPPTPPLRRRRRNAPPPTTTPRAPTCAPPPPPRHRGRRRPPDGDVTVLGGRRAPLPRRREEQIRLDPIAAAATGTLSLPPGGRGRLGRAVAGGGAPARRRRRDSRRRRSNVPLG